MKKEKTPLKVNNGHSDADEDSPIKTVSRRSTGSRKRILSSSDEDGDDETPVKIAQKGQFCAFKGLLRALKRCYQRRLNDTRPNMSRKSNYDSPSVSRLVLVNFVIAQPNA